MDWKLFASTFALVFLAELGDKTQLTAMAASAGNKSTLSVFLGASVALVLSTLIAVLVGSTMQKYLPEKAVKIGAAALFFLFGALLVVSVVRGETKEAAAPVKKTGVLAKVILQSALKFEKATAKDYLKLAQSVQDEHARSVLTNLSQEEQRHESELRSLSECLQEEECEWEETTPSGGLWVEREITPETKTEIQSAIEHELATARFYEVLSTKIPSPTAKPVLTRLAKEEHRHAEKLSRLV